MDAYFLLVISAVFLIAGMVKGIIGLGLPTISLALLTLLLDLPTAMLLMLVPSLITNCWQAVVGESVLKLIRLQWPFFLSATLMIGVGAFVLNTDAVIWLPALLGLLLIVYSIFGFAGKKLNFNQQNQRWFGPMFGAVNGVLTGMTGSFVVPGVLYLQSSGMRRDRLIQSMGILFTLSTAALVVSLFQIGVGSFNISLYSTLGVIPALIGMWLGQKIRLLTSELMFKNIFYLSLIILGLVLLIDVLRSYL